MIRMFEEFRSWLRVLRDIRRIIQDHEMVARRLSDELRDLERILRERTDISADVGFDARAGNHVIVVGRYRNRDFVQVYTVRTDHFAEFIEHLKGMQRYGAVRAVDGPVGFRAVFDRETLGGV